MSWINLVSTTNGVSRPCSLNGYLWKMKQEKKSLVPQWNKRWFSIEGKFLRWYRNPNDASSSGK